MNTASLPPPAPLGWPLLPRPDRDGRLQFPGSLAESVRQQIQVILSTRPGEQLMRPGFGAGLTDFLGQPDTVTTRKSILDRVTESLRQWEPRADLVGLDLTTTPAAPGNLRLEIAYRLKRTGELQNLGVNLEL